MALSVDSKAMLRTRAIIILAVTALSVGCSGTKSSAGADVVGGNAGVAPKSRYDLANACFSLRDVSTGRFLTVSGSTVQLNATALSAATPFFMKPTGLGKYLFYTPDRRFLAVASANEPQAGQLAGIVRVIGQTLSGEGDVLALVHPAMPVSNGLNQAGAAIVGGSAQLYTAATSSRNLGIADAPSDGAEWTVTESAGYFSIASTLTGDQLAINDSAGRFSFVPQGGCTAYPEAELNATGTPFKGKNPDGTVFGYAETHMHLGGSEALGGKLGYGSPFHKFGITHALGNCEVDHGPNGSFDALDAVVNSGRNYFPPHETVGWPTYKDWPSRGSQTHHQTYYMWLKRAWMGGLRFMMNHLVANEALCQLWPLKQNDCNEMDNIALQRQLVLDLQDYIDAQEGGPGKGFFRIVYSSSEARRVIEDGKMAVVFGTENEKIFDCGEYLDMPECTVEHIDEQLDKWYALGLRAIFPIHLFDNALGGTRLTDDPALNVLYQVGNIAETGHPYATIPCEQADSVAPGEAPVQERGIMELVLAQVSSPPPLPPATGCVKNARSLTPLGDHFVNAMVDRGIMIETDHTGTLARKRMLDIAQERHVPVLSGHTGTISDARDSKRILKVGGVISRLPDKPAPVAVAFIHELIAAYTEVNGTTDGLGTGLGSDINGIHVQAAPRSDVATNPLKYPFKSFDGNVSFDKQITGQRVFDLNTDGVAHYGLFPDYIADMQRSEGGEEAVKYLFRSAEAYLRAWERAEQARIKR